MINAITFILVVVGAILLFSGAALSVYGVVFLGLFLGGGCGYLVAPTVGATLGFQGPMAVATSTVLGAAAGGLFGYVLLSAAVALMGFIIGTISMMAMVAPTVSESVWFEWSVALIGGLVAALLGMLLTKWMMVVITSIVGAALASRSLTLEQFTAARQSMHLEPLFFDFHSPLFIALVVLGILSQLGLFRFGYVTRIARTLPGSKMWPSRGREETEPTR